MLIKNVDGANVQETLRIFVTFGDGDFRYRRAATRLASQIEKFGIYDISLALDKRWLKNCFPSVYRSIIQNSRKHPVRGYGYWIWKYCALEYVGFLYPNAIIHYADCGHSAKYSKETYDALVKCIEKCSSSGYLGWELPDCKEIEFSKAELVSYMNFSLTEIEKNQLDASQFFLSATNAIYIAKQVLDVFNEHFDLLLDSTSVPQSQFFKKHRHDQSVLSLIWKRNWQLQQVSMFEKPLDHYRDLSLQPKSTSKSLELFHLVETFIARIEKYLHRVVWRFMWRP